MFGSVRLVVKPEQPPMMVPTSAVVFDSKGTGVWVVEDNKVKSHPIEIGRDYGTELEAQVASAARKPSSPTRASDWRKASTCRS